jgi:hypothetical protein
VILCCSKIQTWEFLYFVLEIRKWARAEESGRMLRPSESTAALTLPCMGRTDEDLD